MNWHHILCRSTLGLALIAGQLHAQEPAQPAAPTLPPPRDPVIRVLVQTNPSTPSALVKLITTLTDLREGRYAVPFVQKLIDLNLDDEQLAALHREVGSAFFVKISAQPELQPIGAQFASDAMTRIDTRARDPQRLAGLIEKLGDPAPGVKRLALAELQQGRDAAVQALLTVLVDDAQTDAHANVQYALSIFGSEAFAPIAALVRDGSDAIKQRAINVLGRLEHPDAPIYALGPAFLPSSSPALRAAALNVLRGRGELTASDAGFELYKFANDYYTGKRTLSADESGFTSIWKWDADAGQLGQTKILAQLATAQQVLRFARDARTLLPQSVEVRRLYLGALIEAKQSAAMTTEGEANPLVAELKNEGVDALLDLIDNAIQTGRNRVAFTGLTTLGEVATPDILRTVDGRAGLVAHALRNPRREIRFAALDAVAKLGPTDVFPGSSYVAETADYLLRTTGRPRALVADPRVLNAPALSGIAANLGFRPVVAHDARSTVRTAIQSGDIELILIDMLLAAPSSGHLISSLRRDARTATVPIVIITSEPDDVPRAESIARQAGFAATVSADGDLGDFRAAATSAGVVPSTGLLRVKQAKQVLTWFAALDVPARQRYGWQQLEAALLEALEQPELAPLTAKLLGEFSSVTAQSALVNYASFVGRPIELRTAAANAFRASVKQFGILLTSQQMLTQYDRYNASERRPKAEQDVLASILDTLEGVVPQAGPATSATTPKPAEGERE
ncbi:MAG: hypothetical protein JNM18_00005 [Planctomycetaceae bacterium]|nr:hypothetical protein [Planctomycetaceae bacterium]